MLYLRFEPIGKNVWAVKRPSKGKIAEVALSLDDGKCRLIPVQPYVLDVDEAESIIAFMAEQQYYGPAIHADWRETR